MNPETNMPNPADTPPPEVVIVPGTEADVLPPPPIDPTSPEASIVMRGPIDESVPAFYGLRRFVKSFQLAYNREILASLTPTEERQLSARAVLEGKLHPKTAIPSTRAGSRAALRDSRRRRHIINAEADRIRVSSTFGRTDMRGKTFFEDELRDDPNLLRPKYMIEHYTDSQGKPKTRVIVDRTAPHAFQEMHEIPGVLDGVGTDLPREREYYRTPHDLGTSAHTARIRGRNPGEAPTKEQRGRYPGGALTKRFGDRIGGLYQGLGLDPEGLYRIDRLLARGHVGAEFRAGRAYARAGKKVDKHRGKIQATIEGKVANPNYHEFLTGKIDKHVRSLEQLRRQAPAVERRKAERKQSRAEFKRDVSDKTKRAARTVGKGALKAAKITVELGGKVAKEGATKAKNHAQATASAYQEGKSGAVVIDNPVQRTINKFAHASGRTYGRIKN